MPDGRWQFDEFSVAIRRIKLWIKEKRQAAGAACHGKAES
jgi:hypothetical protein